MNIKDLKVLVACESSGTVRDAFNRLGCNAWSCDILPANGQHIQADVREVLFPDTWDLMIAHPPCTYLCSSGLNWTTRGLRDPKLTEDALDFVRLLMEAPIPHIALENPVGRIGTAIRKADQYVHPYQFGNDHSKTTGLWLKNLPKLTPTNIVEGREARVHRMPPGPDRWKERSRTFEGIGKAMATQWGGPIKAESEAA